MSRTTIEVSMKTNKVDEVLNIIESILEPYGYEKKIFDGENVWMKGDGIVTSMQCFGVVFTENAVLLQGWMKDVILGESALDGIWGARTKKQMKYQMDRIQTRITAKDL
jgi:hypothetical protein